VQPSERFHPGLYRKGEEELVVRADLGQPLVAVTFTKGPSKSRRTGITRKELSTFERVEEGSNG
jgi:hypothetical protein